MSIPTSKGSYGPAFDDHLDLILEGWVRKFKSVVSPCMKSICQVNFFLWVYKILCHFLLRFGRFIKVNPKSE